MKLFWASLLMIENIFLDSAFTFINDTIGCSSYAIVLQSDCKMYKVVKSMQQGVIMPHRPTGSSANKDGFRL